MTKKIFSLCMVFAMMTVLAFVTSCSKEETTVIGTMEVTISFKTVNAEGIILQDATDVDIKRAFEMATNTANGTQPNAMAGAVKKYFKANLQSVLTARDKKALNDSKMYFQIDVNKKSDGSLIGEEKLYGSEL